MIAMTDNVALVILNVKLVPLLLTVVILVLIPEKIVHQNVHVITDGLKSLMSVKDVMNTDVKPVPPPSLTVSLVNLTEKPLHQNVHVLMENMKKMITLVTTVMLNVKLVKDLPLIVKNVPDIEKVPQIVTVQLVCSKMPKELVPHVIQNVTLVSPTDLTVLLVTPPPELLKLHLAHVQMDNTKTKKPVTIVTTNVLNVLTQLLIVLNVLTLPETQPQLVTVKPCTITSEPKNNVDLVTTNVLNVMKINSKPTTGHVAYFEEGKSETPHIQGYIEFQNAKTMNAIKKYFNCHFLQ
jgi:hypothetical protein